MGKKKKRTVLFLQWVRIAGITLVLSLLVARLFYMSAWGLLLMPIIGIAVYVNVKKKQRKQERESMQAQFMNSLEVLTASLQAGYSMENAWKDVETELQKSEGEQSQLYLAIREMNRQVAMNQPVERLFLQVAHDMGLEDMISFAEILDYGKRSGGNWRAVIDRTVNRMRNRYLAQREIEVMIAGKKMEQQVMNLIPLGIILFLQISSGDYMDILYHNPFGVCCMTICLGVYCFAMWMAEKIMEIEV